MKRRLFALGALGALSAVAAGKAISKEVYDGGKNALTKWRKLLSKEQFHILFEEGTERPWTSHLNKEKREGTFICAACYQPLFESNTKYESGTGWPSFFRPIEGSVATKRDWKLIVPRTEYHCSRCGGHQGHVFDDGPQPTGKRYCNNGLALEFVAAGEKAKELR